MPALRQAGSGAACALLQPRLQGPRPLEMARRRLSYCGAARRSRNGGQRRERRLVGPFAAEAPPRKRAQVAQLVEHVTENHGVGGSIPPLGTIAHAEAFLSHPKEADMPAKSAAQQKAAGAALAAKRAEKSKSSLKGASKSVASSMSENELKKMDSSKQK